MTQPPPTCTAFAASRRIASGSLANVAVQAKELWDRDRWAQILIFDDLTSHLIEVDLRGTAEEVRRRIEAPGPEPVAADSPADPAAEARRPGRPKLGVVAREVTLLPRHWEWLGAQPGGASVALRKLVDQARNASTGRDRRRHAQDATYRFLTAIAGNEPGYEDALRALFAAGREEFLRASEPWPPDVRDHARRLAAQAFLPMEDSE
jgi:uncharacterized protein